LFGREFIDLFLGIFQLILGLGKYRIGKGIQREIEWIGAFDKDAAKPELKTHGKKEFRWVRRGGTGNLNPQKIIILLNLYPPTNT
jgi:hypothetical protein